MGLTAKNSGGDFELPPAGTHVARCYRLIDLGTQFNERWNSKQHKVSIGWELPMETMSDGRPFSVHAQYTVSLSEKAYLRKHLESWRGRAFTEEELAGFDLNNIIGKPCLVSVVHNQSNGSTFANVSSIAPLMKGQECPEPVNPVQVFDVDSPDMDVFNALSERMQQVIEQSDEWRSRGQKSSEIDESQPFEGGPGDFDDSIPFLAHERGQCA